MRRLSSALAALLLTVSNPAYASFSVVLNNTGAQTWVVPTGCTPTVDVETIGGGGGGSGANTAGGGGGYSAITGLATTLGASISYTVGTGGAGAAGTAGTGGDTWFNGVSLGASSVGAKGGVGAASGANGAGGASGSGVGTTKFSGGVGAGGGGQLAGGGGGAGGPHGVGGAGGWYNSSSSPGGGGGGGGGTAGGNGSGTTGGSGGNNYLGTGGGAVGLVGVAGHAGTLGGGGGGPGQTGPTAGDGGNGTELSGGVAGSGGGSSGTSGTTNGSFAGYYGGGGGSAGAGSGGAAAQGVVVVTCSGTAPTGTTYNPSDRGANAALSYGSLQMKTQQSAYSGARSTTSHTTGKWYFEITVNAVGGTTALSPAFADTSASLTTIPGFDTHSLGYSIFDASFRFNNAQVTSTLGTITAGSVIGVAIDFTNKNAWMIGPNGVWDGVATSNPATNTKGINCASGCLYSNLLNATLFSGSATFAMTSVYNSSIATANFGATAFSNTTPTGFTAWDGTPAVTAVCSLASASAGPC